MKNDNAMIKKLIRIFLPLTFVFIIIVLVVTGFTPKRNKVVIAEVLEKPPTATVNINNNNDKAENSNSSTVNREEQDIINNNISQVTNSTLPINNNEEQKTTNNVTSEPNTKEIETSKNVSTAITDDVDTTEDIEYEEDESEFINDEIEESTTETTNNNQITVDNNQNQTPSTPSTPTIDNNNIQTPSQPNNNQAPTSSSSTNKPTTNSSNQSTTKKPASTNKNTFKNYSHLNIYNQSGKYSGYSVCASGGNSIGATGCGLSSYMAARYILTKKDTNFMSFAHESCNTGLYNGRGSSWQVVETKTYQNKYGIKSVKIKNNYKTIVNELKKGHPVVVMIGYGARTVEQGGFNGTPNQHFIVLVNYNEKKDQIYVYNPTGANTGWTSKSKIQKYVIGCGKLVRSMRKV